MGKSGMPVVPPLYAIPQMTGCPAGIYSAYMEMPMNSPRIEAHRIERWTCAHCGTLREWRSVDPGPKKCESCGAPRMA